MLAILAEQERAKRVAAEAARPATATPAPTREVEVPEMTPMRVAGPPPGAKQPSSQWARTAPMTPVRAFEPSMFSFASLSPRGGGAAAAAGGAAAGGAAKQRESATQQQPKRPSTAPGKEPPQARARKR